MRELIIAALAFWAGWLLRWVWTWVLFWPSQKAKIKARVDAYAEECLRNVGGPKQ